MIGMAAAGGRACGMEAEAGAVIMLFYDLVEVMERTGLKLCKDQMEADLEHVRLSPRHDKGVEVFRAAVFQLSLDVHIAARIEYRDSKGPYAVLVAEEFPFERMKGGRISAEFSLHGGWKMRREIRNPEREGFLEILEEFSPECVRLGEGNGLFLIAERLATWALAAQRIS